MLLEERDEDKVIGLMKRLVVISFEEEESDMLIGKFFRKGIKLDKEAFEEKESQPHDNYLLHRR